jgi:hypothetical protein
MTSDAPGPDQPGSGAHPEPGPGAPDAGEWPAELVPPQAAPARDPDEPAPAAPAPAAPVPDQAAPASAPSAGSASGTWGTTPTSGTWGTPPASPPPASQPPASSPAPAAPPVPQATPSQPGQWGAAATPPPAGAGWGAPPAPTSGQPGDQWGAPPSQPGGWAPTPGVPGGPPSGGWAPAPAQSSSNGCLKACLIVGAILVVVAIVGFVALGALVGQFASDMGIDSQGNLKTCELIAQGDVERILGSDAQATPMGGLVDNTIGRVLDQRILPNAPDCWLISGTGSNVTGRIAQQDGNASGTFASARQAAEAGGYFAGDVTFGDEAFCTGMTDVGSFGILVRRGDSLAYVSLLDADVMEAQSFEIGPDGQLVSPQTCDLAGQLAEATLK